MVRTILHLRVPQGWDGVVKKDKIFKYIRTKVIHSLKVFCHPGGLDAMQNNNFSNTRGINQIIKKRSDSMQKRIKVNIGTGKEKLDI